jgi:hypothetical protein
MRVRARVRNVFKSVCRPGAITSKSPAAGIVLAPSQDENNRRLLVLLISASYWLLIFEGVIRKWIFPEYQRALFFLRDPLTLVIYLVAWRYGFGPRRAPFFWIGGLFALASLPLMLFQYAIESTKFVWILALYGWRNYFLYLPLPFIIVNCFVLKDVEALLRRTLWLTIPIAFLVYFQFVSAPTANINQGFGDSENTFSGLALVRGKIRPLGTFTSNQGQSPFVAASLAMLFIAWTTPSIRSRMKTLGLVAATGSTLSMIALSGSRTAVLWSALIVVFAVAAALLSSKRRSPIPMLLVPGALVLVAIVVLPVAYPDATTAFVDRWDDAQEVEVAAHGSGGVFSRALNDLFLFRHLMTEQHLEGYQMGIGGNAANLMGTQSAMMHLETYPQGIALESEWGRHVADMGMMGVLFIFYRIVFSVWLFFQAARATLRTGNSHPMLLFGFAGILLFNGQITGQGTQNGFVWLFVGFTLSACRTLRIVRRIAWPREVRPSFSHPNLAKRVPAH